MNNNHYFKNIAYDGLKISQKFHFILLMIEKLNSLTKYHYFIFP